MQPLLLLVTLAPALAWGASVNPATTYKDCQKITTDPLDGCPEGTLYVSNSDEAADFSTIQAAVRSLPNDTSSHVILIGSGIYTEQVNVTRPGPLTLLGQSNRPSDGERYAAVSTEDADDAQNEVQIFYNLSNGAGSGLWDNLFTSVLVVGPTLNATLTGSGPNGLPVPEDTPFGNVDFRAYNIDFRNEFAPQSSGPAHAVAVAYANAGFYSCGFYSYQDTVFIGKVGNAMMYDSIVAGQTDFLYGFGTLYMDQSSLLRRACGGGLTAWKGANTTFENKYGVYVANSQVIATNATILENFDKECSLGREWNMNHRSLFMHTYLDETTLPKGYATWRGEPRPLLTTMALYNVSGPGNNQTAQIEGNVTQVFTREEARPYLHPIDVFREPMSEEPSVDWIDPVVSVGCKKVAA